jgi:hypothetical protein
MKNSRFAFRAAVWCIAAIFSAPLAARGDIIPLVLAPGQNGCPAGPNPCDSGWRAITPTDGTVSGIVVDQITANSVSIQIDKDFLFAPDITGTFPAINIIFEQTLPDANTVPRIIIEDESVTNQTGVTWTDFHWAIPMGSSGFAWFNQAMSTPFNTSPFNNQSWADTWGYVDPNKQTDLNVDGGSLPHGASFFPGLIGGNGALVMEVDLSLADTDFVLKEFPTPEPATLALVAFGALGLIRRRRA